MSFPPNFSQWGMMPVNPDMVQLSPFIPITAKYIVTESGDFLTTESGIELTTEN